MALWSKSILLRLLFRKYMTPCHEREIEKKPKHLQPPPLSHNALRLHLPLDIVVTPSAIAPVPFISFIASASSSVLNVLARDAVGKLLSADKFACLVEETLLQRSPLVGQGIRLELRIQ